MRSNGPSCCKYNTCDLPSGLAKTIQEGTMKGKRRCRQKKMCGDHIKKLIGMDFASSTWQLKTGQDGKELLQSYLWCPNNIARL